MHEGEILFSTSYRFLDQVSAGNLVVETWSRVGAVYIFLHRAAAAGIKTGPVRDFWGIVGLRLWDSHFISQREAQSCPGPVNHG